jgi:hypothetical protein
MLENLSEIKEDILYLMSVLCNKFQFHKLEIGHTNSSSLIADHVKKVLDKNTNLFHFSKIVKNELYHSSGMGYVVLNLSIFRNNGYSLNDISSMLCFICGKPFLLYEDKPFWLPLGVDLNAAPNRTHGVGCNPLHIDLISREKPPEIIVFLGKRSDPLGGGYTELADLKEASKELNKEEIKLLNMPIFTYWKDHNVCNVGKHINYFSIIPNNVNSEFIRYTAKMIPHLDGSNKVIKSDLVHLTDKVKEALKNFEKILSSKKQKLLVEKDHLLIFNQKKFAHARTKLGQEQSSVTDNERRLIFQSYIQKN